MNIKIELTEYQANYLRRILYKSAKDHFSLAAIHGVLAGMGGPYYMGIMLEAISDELSSKLGMNNLSKFEKSNK